MTVYEMSFYVRAESEGHAKEVAKKIIQEGRVRFDAIYAKEVEAATIEKSECLRELIADIERPK